MADQLTKIRREIRGRLQEKESMLSTIKLRVKGSVLLPDTMDGKHEDALRDWAEKEFEVDIELLKSVMREIG